MYSIHFEQETLSSVVISSKHSCEHDEVLAQNGSWVISNWIPVWTVGRVASLASHETWYS